MLGQYNLALKLDAGEGVGENDAEALRWFRKAAAQGEPDAQYRVALLYAAGEGTELDLAEAHAWLVLAVEQDHKDAVTMLEKVRATMTEDDETALSIAEERLVALRKELKTRP